MAAPLISSDSAFPPDRLDSLFRLELSGLGGMIRNSQIRKCALTIGADPRSQDRVFLEFYRSDDKHPIVMSRPTRELAKVYEIDARDRAVLERLALIPAFDPFTLRTALRKAGRDLRKAGVLEEEAAEPDEAVLSLSAGTRGMLAEHTIRFTDPLLGALLGPAGDPSKTPAERLAEAEANEDPDARAALSRNGLLLRRKFSAASLSDLTELIEDFGEKFLSISYFERYHSLAIHPPVEDLLKELDDLEFRCGRRGGADFKALKSEAAGLFGDGDHAIRRLLFGIERALVSVWDDPGTEFALRAEMASLIDGCHAALGSVLVDWALRLDAWNLTRRDGRLQNPEDQADFLRRRILPGLSASHAELSRLVEALDALEALRKAPALPAPDGSLAFPDLRRGM